MGDPGGEKKRWMVIPPRSQQVPEKQTPTQWIGPANTVNRPRRSEYWLPTSAAQWEILAGHIPHDSNPTARAELVSKKGLVRKLTSDETEHFYSPSLVKRRRPRRNSEREAEWRGRNVTAPPEMVPQNRSRSRSRSPSRVRREVSSTSSDSAGTRRRYAEIEQEMNEALARQQRSGNMPQFTSNGSPLSIAGPSGLGGTAPPGGYYAYRRDRKKSLALRKLLTKDSDLPDVALPQSSTDSDPPYKNEGKNHKSFYRPNAFRSRSLSPIVLQEIITDSDSNVSLSEYFARSSSDSDRPPFNPHFIRYRDYKDGGKLHKYYYRPTKKRPRSKSLSTSNPRSRSRSIPRSPSRSPPRSHQRSPSRSPPRSPQRSPSKSPPRISATSTPRRYSGKRRSVPNAVPRASSPTTRSRADSVNVLTKLSDKEREERVKMLKDFLREEVLRKEGWFDYDAWDAPMSSSDASIEEYKEGPPEVEDDINLDSSTDFTFSSSSEDDNVFITEQSVAPEENEFFMDVDQAILDYDRYWEGREYPSDDDDEFDYYHMLNDPDKRWNYNVSENIETVPHSKAIETVPHSKAFYQREVTNRWNGWLQDRISTGKSWYKNLTNKREELRPPRMIYKKRDSRNNEILMIAPDTDLN